MRALACVLVLLFSTSAASSQNDALASWWRSLSEDARYGIQADLVLLGFYDGLVDGAFGPRTSEAIGRFQLSFGETGPIPSPVVIEGLRSRADEAYETFGFTLEENPAEGVAALVPRAVLTTTMPSEDGGKTFASADQGIVLHFAGWEDPGGPLADWAPDLLKPTSSRTVTYRAVRDDRVVVSGRQDGNAYYSILFVDHPKVVGVTVSWTDQYASTGAIIATFVASYSGTIARLGQLEPASPAQTPPQEPPQSALATMAGERFGPFILPTQEPRAIVLAGDIVTGTMLEFRRALRARPAASTLLLDSFGGSVNEGLLLAHEVADRELSTFVPDEAMCFSACAYVFFAGQNRAANGALGVHQIYGDGVSAADAQAVLSDVLDALAEFDVPQEVVSVMLRTRPEQMHIFTASEKALLQLNRGDIDSTNFISPGAGTAGTTVLHKTSSASDLADGRTERILTIQTATPIASLLASNGFTDPMIEAVIEPLASQYRSATLPVGARLRILYGSARTSEVLVPYRLSLYLHDSGTGTNRHVATVALTDRGTYVAGLEPGQIVFPDEDLPPTATMPDPRGGKTERLRPNHGTPRIDVGL